MAKIFLNEGTEIEVKESKLEIRGLIMEDVRDEIADHFIEVTRIETKIDYKNLDEKNLPTLKDPIEYKIDLYYKRILFIYD